MFGLFRLKSCVEEIWSLMGLYLSHQAGARERAVLARLATLILLGLRTCQKDLQRTHEAHICIVLSAHIR